MPQIPATLADGSISLSTSWVSAYTAPVDTAAHGLLLEAFNTSASDTYFNVRVTRSSGTARRTRRGLLEASGGHCLLQLTRLSKGDEIEIQTESSVDAVDWILSGAEVATP